VVHAPDVGPGRYRGVAHVRKSRRQNCGPVFYNICIAGRFYCQTDICVLIAVGLNGMVGQTVSVFPKEGSKNGITLHEYTKYLMLHSPILRRAGRLRQAWVLEQYLRCQHNTLNYLRENNMNFKKARRDIVRNVLRVRNILDQRQRVIDMLRLNEGLSNRYPLSNDIQESMNYDSLVLDGHDHHHHDTNETFTAGDLMYLPGYKYLPSSFPGGPRCQMLRFADAMTIAAKLGGPHFFTTFTTSPSWEELRQHRRDCPYIEDCMDTECRVFKEKLTLFLEDLRDGIFFEGRKLMYIIHVIEFQWRGHPHAHIVYRLHGDRLTPDEIDRMITTSYAQCKTEEEKE
jgi:Helitron helicase-like domain at N-terminus